MKEEKIKRIIPYFRKLILDKINSNEKKLFSKILNEIIEILSYIKDNLIIEFDEIKFALSEDFNNINDKTRYLIIELLLKQNKIKNQIEL